MANDVWEVYQRFEVMRTGEAWDVQPFDALVWQCDAKNKITVTPKSTPPNYVKGLLRIKLNGVQAMTQEFDVKLAELKLTRADIMKAIS